MWDYFAVRVAVWLVVIGATIAALFGAVWLFVTFVNPLVFIIGVLVFCSVMLAIGLANEQ